MKKKYVLSLLLTFIGQVLWGQAKEDIYLPSNFPDRVILSVGENGGKTRTVNWRVKSDAVEQYVQWTESDASSNLQQTATQYPAAQKVNREGVEAKYCEYTFRGLKSGKTYVYRVGGGDYWTEWFQFSMPLAEEQFSFNYFGDAQNDMRDLWSRSTRAALLKNPQADFWIHLGDMVNDASSNLEWGEWHYGGGWMMSCIPQVLVPGNHEYIKENDKPVINRTWRDAYHMPKNGPKGLEELVYYFDHKHVRFVIIDSRDMLIDDEKSKVQAEWLDQVLSENTQKWTIVCHHHPIFSARGNRGDYKFGEYLEPIYKKYKVDLVLQGHHHSFARGRGEGEVGAKKQSGPLYFLSNSGPKMYDTNFADWMERVGTNVQLFHVINVEGNELEILTYLVNGELYDHVELVKLKNGDKKFKEVNIDGVEERLEFSTASFGADIDPSPEYVKTYKERAEQYLKRRNATK